MHVFQWLTPGPNWYLGPVQAKAGAPKSRDPERGLSIVYTSSTGIDIGHRLGGLGECLAASRPLGVCGFLGDSVGHVHLE